MRRTIIKILLIVTVLGFAITTDALGVGTPAGTPINNTANIDYDVLGVAFSLADSETFTVDEIVSFSLTWQDASNIQATSGELGSILTFRITNTGNGIDSYTLNVDNALAGDDFDPILSGIFLDTNGNSTYDVAADLPYAGTTGDIAADASLNVFVLNDMLPGPFADGLLGDSTLTATSSVGADVEGTVTPGGGDLGTLAILDSSEGEQSATGTHEITTLNVSVFKSAMVTDLHGGTTPTSGATITYTLTVTATGSGTAVGVIITDPIPANTTYTPDSLTLDDGGGAAALTDTDADIDGGDVTAATVTVDIGDITDATATQIITFEVTID